MTTVIRCRRLSVVLLVVLGLALSACSSGPSQVNAAAIVAGKSIGVDRVQELVAKAVKAEPAAQVLADQRKLDLLSRAVIRQLVLHELVADYAAKNNVTVNEEQVAKLSADLSASLKPLPTDGSVPPSAIVEQAVNKAFDADEIARDYLLLATIGGVAAASLAVTFDFIVIAPGTAEEGSGSMRDKATAKAKELARGSVEDAERIIDEEVKTGGQAGKGETITPAAAPEIAGSLLFGAPKNSVVAFQPNAESGGWVVALIRERATDAKSAEQPTPDPKVATVLGPRLLQQSVRDLDVRISPRYGVWDIASMGVAAEGETTGEVYPIAGPALRDRAPRLGRGAASRANGAIVGAAIASGRQGLRERWRGPRAGRCACVS
ncbi:MAG: hypothetical protein M3548_19465 [Actinomycetota bacterium]|nr:hypothetical protein [Actinomycetota bacterium]